MLEQARATVRSGELGQRVRALEAVRWAAAISNSVELRREVIAALTLPDLRFEGQLPNGSDFTVTALDSEFERIALGCLMSLAESTSGVLDAAPGAAVKPTCDILPCKWLSHCRLEKCCQIPLWTPVTESEAVTAFQTGDDAILIAER